MYSTIYVYSIYIYVYMVYIYISFTVTAQILLYPKIPLYYLGLCPAPSSRLRQSATVKAVPQSSVVQPYETSKSMMVLTWAHGCPRMPDVTTGNRLGRLNGRNGEWPLQRVPNHVLHDPGDFRHSDSFNTTELISCILCYVMLCHVMSCYVISHYITLRSFVWYFII